MALTPILKSNGPELSSVYDNSIIFDRPTHYSKLNSVWSILNQ